MPEERTELLAPERPRAILALCLLPIYLFAFPAALTLLGVSFYAKNYLYFAAGFALATALFFPFLRQSIRAFSTAKGCVMRALAAGAIIHYCGTYLFYFALLFHGVSVQPVNNDLVRLLVRHSPALMLLLAVIAAPVTEECFFRGALFGTLRKKSRSWAYLVTIAVFSLLHVLPGLFAGKWEDLYTALLYVPASAALCYAYEASGTVVTSLLLHMAINAVACLSNLIV